MLHKYACKYIMKWYAMTVLLWSFSLLIAHPVKSTNQNIYFSRQCERWCLMLMWMYLVLWLSVVVLYVCCHLPFMRVTVSVECTLVNSDKIVLLIERDIQSIESWSNLYKSYYNLLKRRVTSDTTFLWGMQI